MGSVIPSEEDRAQEERRESVVRLRILSCGRGEKKVLIEDWIELRRGLYIYPRGCHRGGC
jgi:hypothetical protein